MSAYSWKMFAALINVDVATAPSVETKLSSCGKKGKAHDLGTVGSVELGG
jgi:hypothetical protein